jgi:SIR2-like protein
VTFHDPRREVEKVRDHLASHDKPIAFLIGAGASCAVKDQEGEPLIPAVGALGELCEHAVAAMGDHYKQVYDTVASHIEATPGRRPGQANIEEILSAVRLAMAAMSGGDTVGGGTKEQLEEIEKAIRGRIAAAALPDEIRLPPRLPHHALARWIRRVERGMPVEIFTTNYDTLLERALEDQRIPFYDGFAGGRNPFFLGATPVQDYEPGRGWTRLWKIHGSVTWAWHDVPEAPARIVRGREQPGGELILPSFHKYDESRRQPYASMLDRLTRVLTAREDTLLVTLGFSFSDEHLNAVIFDALETRARLSVVALQHSDPAEDHDLVKRARSHPNLLVYGPQQGTVGGETASWRLTEAVDNRTADLLDIPFDSDAKPGADEIADTGRFRLGDFAWFARFLDTLSRPDA